MDKYFGLSQEMSAEAPLHILPGTEIVLCVWALLPPPSKSD